MLHTHTHIPSIPFTSHGIHIFFTFSIKCKTYFNYIIIHCNAYIQRIPYTVYSSKCRHAVHAVPTLHTLHTLASLHSLPCIPFIPRWPTLTCFFEHRHAILYFPTSTSICTIRNSQYDIQYALRCIEFHSIPGALICGRFRHPMCTPAQSQTGRGVYPKNNHTNFFNTLCSQFLLWPIQSVATIFDCGRTSGKGHIHKSYVHISY